ncbi:antibiotic biosynthesis monooxygenase [Bacillus toyonensis]|uniref:antibiotic biosynthesis monooxygenase family protein n=1 Tax=Bacillus toyonensis TaxID=155322 RepID=UPI000BEDF3CC|nr:antibiotic biosynthesis monooxygenase [Bacillus toyonensis]PEE31516.1 antibiotic biosynthesis monooxygenase [Bacillus toyonensis]PEK98494.1 antibiotic biosynthesis monooxygenase [Bacillus toyonensis]PEO33386.1 antibiotic biosynthesis monooxygenase [Bacillus toyonensis]PFX41779.1 antibiotic biosynthesis monooxygenase [Bacillus toyonensis]PFY04074.1 antibiotic biosynthesis monooxygenase [Bacillus toyonensis]
MKSDLEKNKPYYAVIFTSNLSNDTTDYSTVAETMEELAKQQPGFLGVESARDNSGLGITISYWESLEAIKNWKKNALHKEAKKRGREQWYENFHLRVCLVEKEYKFQREIL